MFVLPFTLDADEAGTMHARRPNVVLLVVDALRADHVTGMPGGPDATPSIGAFGEQATVFEQAISPAPWTLPSVTSLLTGLDAHEHGASSHRFQPGRGTPLQKRLSGRGYRTIHVSPTTWIGDWLPQGRGFDHVVEYTGPTHRRWSKGADVRELSRGVESGWRWHATVLRRAMASRAPLQSLANAAAYVYDEASRDPWLDDADASRRASEHAAELLGGLAGRREPFFLFVHLMDPHLPFYVPEAYRSEEVRPPGCEGLEDELAWMAQLMDEIWAVRDGQRFLSEPELAYLRARYRDEVAFADAAVGRILEAIDEHGLREDTLVAITADHGEHLGERVPTGDGEATLVDHQASVHWPVLHVPLLCRLPDTFETDRRDDLVQPHDLAHTIGAMVGIEHDPTRSLLPEDAHDHRTFARASYAGVVPSHPPPEHRSAFLSRPRTSAIVDEWKVDLAGQPSERGTPVPGSIEQADRAARIDRSTGRASEVGLDEVPDEVAAKLEQALSGVPFAGAGPSTATAVDKAGSGDAISGEVRQRLRQLGYIH